ncbi:hypothetical protein DFJ74DRAFT_643017 [Hyaloraphidium curvatum]|nr:hypothetical protein DFJ74DRAFT_643017 [Hyaloraphidium curvatum]
MTAGGEGDAAAGTRAALLSAAAHTAMSACLKALLGGGAAGAGSLGVPRSAPALALVRSLAALAVLALFVYAPRPAWLAVPRPARTLFPAGARALLAVRAALGGLANLSHFAAVSRLDLGVAAVLGGLGPLIAAAAGWALLGEAPARHDLMGMACAFSGVWLISGMPLPFAGSSPRAAPAVGVALAVLASAAKSLGAVLVRMLARRQGDRIHPLHLVSAYSIGTAAVGTLVLLVQPTPPPSPGVSPRELPLLALLALSGFATQLAHVVSLSHLPAHRALLVTSAQAVAGFAAQVAFWGTWPDARTALGGLCVVAGVAMASGAGKKGFKGERERGENGHVLGVENGHAKGEEAKLVAPAATFVPPQLGGDKETEAPLVVVEHGRPHSADPGREEKEAVE